MHSGISMRRRRMRQRRAMFFMFTASLASLIAAIAFLWPTVFPPAKPSAASVNLPTPVAEVLKAEMPAPGNSGVSANANANAANGANASANALATLSAPGSPAPTANLAAAPVSPTPKPSPTPAPTATASPTPAPSDEAKDESAESDDGGDDESEKDELPYYIYVEKGSFTLTIYRKDDNGEYTDVYKRYRIAHGGNKTPAGKFTLGNRERWHEFADGGFVQFAVSYHKRLYIHSPLFGAEDPTTLWTAYYDGSHAIGTDSTGGCLRMVTEASRFIYEKCPEGTVLEIVNGSPKETTSKEPPDRDHKHYDPTDATVDD